MYNKYRKIHGHDDSIIEFEESISDNWKRRINGKDGKYSDGIDFVDKAKWNKCFVL